MRLETRLQILLEKTITKIYPVQKVKVYQLKKKGKLFIDVQ
jgi:hypothetical protein